jgi:hypothetical protein
LAGLADTPASTGDKIVRDESGKIIVQISDTANGNSVRDRDGKIIGKVKVTATGGTVRDTNGKIIDQIEAMRHKPRRHTAFQRTARLARGAAAEHSRMQQCKR